MPQYAPPQKREILNPEVQLAEKFQFKLSRRGRSRKDDHCAHMAYVWKPRR